MRNIAEQQAAEKAAHNPAVGSAGYGFSLICGSYFLYGVPYAAVGVTHRLAALGREVLRVLIPDFRKLGVFAESLSEWLAFNYPTAHFTQAVAFNGGKPFISYNGKRGFISAYKRACIHLIKRDVRKTPL